MLNHCSYLSFTCINHPIELVKEQFYFILKNKDIWTVKFENPDIKLVYEVKPEKGTPNRRVVLWEPKNKNNTTVFVCNLQDGWDTMIHNISLRNNIETFKIIISTNPSDENFINSFHYRNGKKERLIRVMFDKKIEFYQIGEPLPFEDTSHYKKRNTILRLDSCIITKYLTAAGWDINSNDFWTSNKSAVYFEERRSTGSEL